MSSDQERGVEVSEWFDEEEDAEEEEDISIFLYFWEDQKVGAPVYHHQTTDQRSSILSCHSISSVWFICARSCWWVLVCSASNNFVFVFDDWVRLPTVVKSSMPKLMKESESAFNVALKKNISFIDAKKIEEKLTEFFLLLPVPQHTPQPACHTLALASYCNSSSLHLTKSMSERPGIVALRAFISGV